MGTGLVSMADDAVPGTLRLEAAHVCDSAQEVERLPGIRVQKLRGWKHLHHNREPDA